MTTQPCRHAYEDATYVLGALPPEERWEFEAHLDSCEACELAVRDLAGIPGLLARVDMADLREEHLIEPAPTTLWPRLLREAAVERRRQRLRTGMFALAAGIAVLVALAVPVTVLNGDPTPRPPQAGPTTSASTPVDHDFVAVAKTPVTATATVTPVDWGSAVEMKCSYAKATFPDRRSYSLVATNRSGASESIGSWTATAGDEIDLDLSTRFQPTELAALEIRTQDGRSLLRATL